MSIREIIVVRHDGHLKDIKIDGEWKNKIGLSLENIVRKVYITTKGEYVLYHGMKKTVYTCADGNHYILVIGGDH